MQTNHNLVGRVADLTGDVVRMVQTRLEMLSVELRQERNSIVLQLKLGMTSVIAAGVAGVSAVLWAALTLPPNERSAALGVLTFTFIAIAVATMLAAQQHRQRQARLFDSLIAQLGRDRSTLQGSVEPAAQGIDHESTGNSRANP
jgi:uncharacterized membrane protein YqjE